MAARPREKGNASGAASNFFRTFAYSSVHYFEHLLIPSAYGQCHHRERRAREQPEEYRYRHPARQTGGHHRPFGLGQVVVGFRHPLCRRSAPLCREPFGLCPPVSRPHEQARMRLHQGPASGHCHRAEGDKSQPSFHCGHEHRNLRISPPPFCPHRPHLFARER